MAKMSEKSIELYNYMIYKGYSEEFSYIIARNLNTDFTANRMLGYLSYYDRLPDEEVADEMLAILSDRNRIMNKKELESVNMKWNEFLANGFDEEK